MQDFFFLEKSLSMPPPGKASDTCMWLWDVDGSCGPFFSLTHGFEKCICSRLRIKYSNVTGDESEKKKKRKRMKLKASHLSLTWGMWILLCSLGTPSAPTFMGGHKAPRHCPLRSYLGGQWRKHAFSRTFSIPGCPAILEVVGWMSGHYPEP